MISRTGSLLSVAALTLGVASARLVAQTPADSGRCRELLDRAPRDSIVEVIGVHTAAFDPRVRLPREYAAELAQQIRFNLRVPPLHLDLYALTPPSDSPSVKVPTIVVPTVAATYRLTAWRNGTITNPRVIGGARNGVFDAAFLGALQLLNDSLAYPLFPRSISTDSVELVLSVTGDNIATLAYSEAQTRVEGVVTKFAPDLDPLFRMKVPVFGRGEPPKTLTTTHAPTYPELARRHNVEGDVNLQFILAPAGVPEPFSVQVTSATAQDFVDSVLERLPQLRFRPLLLDGCPLPMIVCMPFTFRLTR